ncbi:MAG TPA: Gfo/Idh/MocA family oxidoreductase, partial [bacterium]|nr:Gfo/Idh/MocA family oxidoreductase [bacterium]
MNSKSSGIARRTFLMGLTGTAAANLHGSFAFAMPERKIRMGVVGGGFGCSFYWQDHPNSVVAAVSDLRPDRRDLLSKTFRCGTVYESLEKLILDKSVEAVAVFTGAPDHVRHCTAVMNSGKHVISAVPAALTLEDCQILIDTKEKTGQTYMMAETSYFRQESITAREWFKEG